MNQRIIGTVAGLLASTSLASAQPLPWSYPHPSSSPPGYAAPAIPPASAGFASTVQDTPGQATVSDAPAAPAVPTLPAPTPMPAAAPPAIPLPPQYPVFSDAYQAGSVLAASADCCAPYCCPEAPPQKRIWGQVDYLMWWSRNDHVSVPLVTTDTSVPPQPLFVSGAAGAPGSAVLFGNNNINYSTLSGERVTVGVWLDKNGIIGLEGSGFLLDRNTQTFRRSSDAGGNPVLALPFFNSSLNVMGESAAYAAYPGNFMGGVVITADSQLWGAESNGVLSLICHPHVYWQGLFGFRYLNLREDLNMNVNAFGLTAPTLNQEIDRFQARNEFYGGQLGTRVGLHFGRWSMEMTGKAALGNTHETISLSGSTTQIGISPEGIFPGGVFTQPSNIGTHKRDDFAVVPEARLQFGYDLTCHVRAVLGYTFIYISSVVRPGEQIDRNVNTTQQLAGTLVGPPQPTALLSRSDFWVHGLNFGLAVDW